MLCADVKRVRPTYRSYTKHRDHAISDDRTRGCATQQNIDNDNDFRWITDFHNENMRLNHIEVTACWELTYLCHTVE